jgi:hypothetical protein
MAYDVLNRDPRVLTVEFATLIITAKNWNTENTEQLTTVLNSASNLAKSIRESEKKDDSFLIYMSDEKYLLNINGYFISEISVSNGSISSKIKIAAKITAAIYTGIAAYPSFKDGFNLLKYEIGYALEHVLIDSFNQYISELPEEDPNRSKDVILDSIMQVRREDDLENEVANKIRSTDN